MYSAADFHSSHQQRAQTATPKLRYTNPPPGFYPSQQRFVPGDVAEFFTHTPFSFPPPPTLQSPFGELQDFKNAPDLAVSRNRSRFFPHTTANPDPKFSVIYNYLQLDSAPAHDELPYYSCLEDDSPMLPNLSDFLPEFIVNDVLACPQTGPKQQSLADFLQKLKGASDENPSAPNYFSKPGLSKSLLPSASKDAFNASRAITAQTSTPSSIYSGSSFSKSIPLPPRNPLSHALQMTTATQQCYQNLLQVRANTTNMHLSNLSGQASALSPGATQQLISSQSWISLPRPDQASALPGGFSTRQLNVQYSCQSRASTYFPAPLLTLPTTPTVAATNQSSTLLRPLMTSVIYPTKARPLFSQVARRQVPQLMEHPVGAPSGFPLTETPKRPGTSRAPITSRPVTKEDILLLESNNIQATWPVYLQHGKYPIIQASIEYWKEVKKAGEPLWLPDIIEDSKTATCIYIGLAFVKGILLHLGAQPDYSLEVKARGLQGETSTVITIKHSDFEMDEGLAFDIDCLGLTYDEWTYTQTLDHAGRVIALAFAVFSKRGIRKVSEHHLEVIVKTIVYSQVAFYVSKKMNDPQWQSGLPLERVAMSELLRFLYEMKPVSAPSVFDSNVYASFGVALILSKEYAQCHGGYVPSIDNYWSTPRALVVHSSDFHMFHGDILGFHDQIKKKLWRFSEDRSCTKSPARTPNYFPSHRYSARNRS